MVGIPTFLRRLNITPPGRIGQTVEISPDRKNEPHVKREASPVFGADLNRRLAIEYVKKSKTGWVYGFVHGKQFKEFETSWFQHQKGQKKRLILLATVITAIATLTGPLINIRQENRQNNIQQSEQSATPNLDDSIKLSSLKTIWGTEETKQAELEASIILVATPNFEWDVSDQTWSKLVLDNMLEGGVSYYYLFPQYAELEEKAKTLFSQLEQRVGKDIANKTLHFISVPADEFIWELEHVYYDPGLPKATALAISSIHEILSDSSTIIDMNTVLDADQARKFLEQFTKLWNTKNKTPEWSLGS